MKTFLFISFLLFVGNARGAGPVGQVQCDLTSPRQTGFTLVKFWAPVRAYEGSEDVEGLRVQGKYRPDDHFFTLQISRIDPDTNDSGEPLAESSVYLHGAEFHRLAFALPGVGAGGGAGASRVEIFCRVGK